MIHYQASPYAVSVIIPTYGRPLKLQSCISSLACQTFSEPWEIVVVDDGSPIPVDDRLLISEVDSHSVYPHIRVVRQVNAGPAVARNHGVKYAQAELIAFVDDDCRPHSNWLEQLVGTWRLRSSGLIGGKTTNGLCEDLYAEASQLIVSLVYDYFNSDPENSYFLASNNILCSKRQFQQINGFLCDFPRAGAEDRDFCDRWRMMRWPIVWDKKAVIYHYHNQDLPKFVRLHARYGRGAYIYQHIRRMRGSGLITEDMGFHARLPKLLTSQYIQNRWSLVHLAKIIFALSVWQLANAFGFMLEWILARCPSEMSKKTMPSA